MIVEWTDRALDDAEKLDSRTRERVISAIDRLAETGYGDTRRLAGTDDQYRLRVGRYRIRYIHDQTSHDRVIRILRVLPRDRAYRGDD